MSDIQLTPKEQRIYDQFIKTGRSNKELARDLSVSEATIKMHMTNIIRKYHVHTRYQLMAFSK